MTISGKDQYREACARLNEAYLKAEELMGDPAAFDDDRLVETYRRLGEEHPQLARVIDDLVGQVVEFSIREPRDD